MISLRRYSYSIRKEKKFKIRESYGGKTVEYRMKITKKKLKYEMCTNNNRRK